MKASMPHTLSLADFLLARIAEDEDAAKLAADRQALVTKARVNGVWLNSRYHMTVDPARMLAECEAKRRLVRMREDAGAWMGREACAHATGSTLSDRDHGWAMKGRFDALETTIRVLSLPYIAHPDYRREWAW